MPSKCILHDSQYSAGLLSFSLGMKQVTLSFGKRFVCFLRSRSELLVVQPQPGGRVCVQTVRFRLTYLFILFLFFKKTYLLCIAVLEINRTPLVVASLTTETAGDLIRKWINRKFCHCCGVCLPDTTLLNTFNQTALYLAKLTGLKNWGQVCVCPM